MNPVDVFPPPPPPSGSISSRESKDGSSLLLVSRLTEECHQLRQELIQQTKQIQEQQQYISELEEAIRVLGDDYDGKLEIIGDLKKQIETFEKQLSDKDKQHAKQLSLINRSHNEELEALLQEFLALEHVNANLKAQVMQYEEQLNEKESILLDYKDQIRECKRLMRENANANGFPILNVQEIEKSSDLEAFRSLDNLELKEGVESEIDEVSIGKIATVRRDNSSTMKNFPSIRRKFSESDEDDEISPDKLTIRRDLSNKHHQKLKSLTTAIDGSGSFEMANKSKVVTFANEDRTKANSPPTFTSTSSHNLDGSNQRKMGGKEWKNDRKHLNVYREIELEEDKSYFNWESGESAPATPERQAPHKPTALDNIHTKSQSAVRKNDINS